LKLPSSERRKLHVEFGLPMRDEYDAFVLASVDRKVPTARPKPGGG